MMMRWRRFQCEKTLIPNMQHALLLIRLTIIIIALHSVMATSSHDDPPIAKPSCIDRCGNISIPFPFGTTADCYHSRPFRVTCNSTFHKPPKLFWDNSTVEIKHISLLGQMTIMSYVASDCDNGTGNSASRSLLRLADFFTVNNTVNKFTIVGCDAYGYILGNRIGRKYATGCTATCYSKSDLENGSCNGIGCCQTQIPNSVCDVNVKVHSFKNYSEVREVTNCTYGFLVEESAFSFHQENLTNLKDVAELPVVVDWAFGNGTCAQKNTSEYVCKSSNSYCYKPGNSYGYRCLCKIGYHGNPYLIDGCQDINECSPGPGQNKSCHYLCINTPGSFICRCPKGYHGDGKIGGKGCSPRDVRTLILTVLGISLGIVLLLLIAALAYLKYNRSQLKRMRRKFFVQNGGQLLLGKLPAKQGLHDTFTIFTSSQVKNATSDFHKDNIIGQGGFGTVYKGTLPDQTTVAIKKSKRVDPDQAEQFVNEVIVLSKINHRNTVKLLGCCLETEVPHLVYEFVSNGTLGSYLHNPSRAHLLNWEKRLRIATESADVLSYLHSAASIPIIHRDVKPENILLSHDFTTKVSDFGASRFIPLDQTQISTLVQGTIGYLDPEYLLTHQLTAKSDVYSFGVVLLELITGRKPIQYAAPEVERSLVNYSMFMLGEDAFSLLIDCHISREEYKEEIMEVAYLAAQCVRVKGEERPDMKVIAMELESLRRRSRYVESKTQIEQNAQTLIGEELDSINNSGCGTSTSTATAGSGSAVDQPGFITK